MSMRRGNAPSSAETAKRGPGGGPAPAGRGARRPPGAAAAARPAPARARPDTPPRATFARLRALHPDAHCELDHKSSFELLVATVLSAQTTDVLVNKVTPHLFAAYPDARALAGADPAEVGALLRRLGMGMFNQKARNVVGLARGLVERHGGEVPRTLAELVELSGVGRKTANVVLGVAFGAPEGVVVDTHVQRLSQRLGWTKSDKPEQIERDLMALFPKRDWDMLSHTLIFHGRRICFARKPACGGCGVNDACPSAFHAENVGRKAPRSPRRGGAQA
ncbi:endonuclease III [Sorangium cellulosum]|uniref:Endonuclease III n=1 Tax=Sorangium cellulosum TaxID=56 RepID=A0A4P2QRJ2_SORCE|nr:endonuclease III [Sorangium cellulosum]WCQ92182.1 Endonuclease III [Sorangium sp. Soce836]